MPATAVANLAKKEPALRSHGEAGYTAAEKNACSIDAMMNGGECEACQYGEGDCIPFTQPKSSTREHEQIPESPNSNPLRSLRRKHPLLRHLPPHGASRLHQQTRERQPHHLLQGRRGGDSHYTTKFSESGFLRITSKNSSIFWAKRRGLSNITWRLSKPRRNRLLAGYPCFLTVAACTSSSLTPQR